MAIDNKIDVIHDEIITDTSSLLREHIINMSSQAHFSINCLSRDLDANLTNNHEFINSIRHVIKNSKNIRIHFLVHNIEKSIHHGHRIIDLAQRLSSYITIKILSNEYKHHNNAFMVVDNSAVIYREQSDRFDSIIEYSNKQKAEKLNHFFKDAWEHGLSDENLLRLHI